MTRSYTRPLTGLAASFEASGGAPEPECMQALQEKYNLDMRGEVRRFSQEN